MRFRRVVMSVVAVLPLATGCSVYCEGTQGYIRVVNNSGGCINVTIGDSQSPVHEDSFCSTEVEVRNHDNFRDYLVDPGRHAVRVTTATGYQLLEGVSEAFLCGTERVEVTSAPQFGLSVQVRGTARGGVTSESGVTNEYQIECGELDDGYDHQNCTYTATANEVVTLRAKPLGDNSRFDGWSGACSGTQDTCDVTMSQARNVIATFIQISSWLRVYVSNFAQSGGRITILETGQVCDAWESCLFQDVDSALSFTFLAETTLPNTSLGEWIGACTGQPLPTCTVTMANDRDVVLYIHTDAAASHDLTVTVNGGGTVKSESGSIDCPAGACSVSEPVGTQVELTAIAPAATSTSATVFTGWGGACSGSNYECILVMSQDTTAVANFAPHTGDIWSLFLSIDGQGTGTVTSNPLGISCVHEDEFTNTGECSAYFAGNSNIAMKAVPQAGSRFEGWTAPCPAFADTCVRNLQGYANQEARFAPSAAPCTGIVTLDFTPSEFEYMLNVEVTDPVSGTRTDSETMSSFPGRLWLTAGTHHLEVTSFMGTTYFDSDVTVSCGSEQTLHLN
ncbi:MAG: hypothetical protein L0Y66_08320 [Myxococcaceae bacterium]|nr:hypothetical protein [Myxococcaceae bacterium]MCI0671246.1 hypothetical protein [Myxococcaceae bacterium]